MISGEKSGHQIGEYRLVRKLGGGGFGEVYLAEENRTHEHVAIKLLSAKLTQKEEFRAFLNEARIFRLKHPHIIQLLDLGVTKQDQPFLVMEYAPNGTLRSRYPKGSQVPLHLVVDYVQAIASALQYAHERRLIHRDVKPENILLGANGQVLLSDFGIVTVAHSSHSLDATQAVGTLPYMAPEQSQGKPRPASDQYALGIMVYEWLCGERPFGGTPTEIMMQHLFKPPPSLCEKVPTISRDVEHVILMALAKDPADRWASIEAFATALQAAADVQRLPNPGSTEMSNSLADGRVTSSANTTADRVSLTVQTNEQDVAVLPPMRPSVKTKTSVPSRLPSNATDGRATTPASLSWSQEKKPLPSATITPSFPSARKRFPIRRAMILVLLVLIVMGSGGVWAVLHPTIPRSPAAPTPYDRFVMKSGTQFGFDAQHSHFNPYESELSPTTAATLVRAWTAPTGNSITSSPAVANGVVYVGSQDHKLYAFKANGCGQSIWPFVSTCSPLWTAITGDLITSSPVMANGVVYVGSQDHKLYAFKANGCGQSSCSPLWTSTTSDGITSSPAVANGVVYVGSKNGTLYAFQRR